MNEVSSFCLCRYRAADEMPTATEDAKPVVQTRKKRQKQKSRSSLGEDDSSSDALEQLSTAPIVPASASRCLRSRDSAVSPRVNKRRASSDIDDDNGDDEDYEPEAVNRHKRRNCRRR